MLKKRNLIFLCLLILGVFLVTSCLPKPPVTEGILKGQVIVPEGSVQEKQLTGQALADAKVNIIDPATGAIIATTITDANGYYQVFVPAGGPYLLQAVKDEVKILQITPQVEVGIEYDLGTADCSTTAVALIVQAMLDAEDYPNDPADINLADIEADPDFDDVMSIVCSKIEAGEDPALSEVVQQAVEDFLYPPAPASTPPAAPTPIDIAAIPGVTAPVIGATPVGTITATAQYTGTVTWNPAGDPFAGATIYTATITLTAKAGFTLTGVAADFFTVAGATTVTNTADSGVVTAVFPETAAAVIDIAAIPGVTAPVTGATPVGTITATAQYTGTVTWNPADDPFAEATIYTATITLTAKAGFTLTGVTADFFTVAGATTVTNTADSGVVTAVFPETAAVIDIAAIPGVTAPVIGATPVGTITATAQYTGTVTWNPADDPFAGATIYTATITLTAKAGFTLTGVAADFFTVAGATTVTNTADSGVVTAVFPETAAAVIDIAAIPGVTAPVTGATPVGTITATAQYTGTVTWNPADDPFAEATIYTATITLTAKAGFTLTGVTADFFTVAGATTVTNTADSGVVTAVFPETAAVIDIAAIPGVTAPVTGATPVGTITATAQYTGTVTWNPADDPFAEATIYTATITLTAKAGFTLTGVAADFFTVAGATTVTNTADSGVVTAVFPETAAAVIDIAAIPGVTAPVTGATPVGTITATAQYTGTVTWNPADDPFAEATIYTATITLTAKAGFTLTGVTADFFTVAGATTVTNTADSGVVTAVFPETVAVTVNVGDSYGGGIVAYILQSGDPGYDANIQHGLIAATADQSTGIHWYNGSLVVTGATGTAIGSGQANTTAIVTIQGAGSYAAQLCNDLTEGGYNDWFLPSKDELDKLYINKVAIGGFTGDYYWSSSEFDVNNAWCVFLHNGDQFTRSKWFTRRVRAVRAF